MAHTTNTLTIRQSRYLKLYLCSKSSSRLIKANTDDLAYYTNTRVCLHFMVTYCTHNNHFKTTQHNAFQLPAHLILFFIALSNGIHTKLVLVSMYSHWFVRTCKGADLKYNVYNQIYSAIS